MLFPEQLVKIFSPDGEPALMAFSARTMRIMFLMLPVVAFVVISTTFFVVTGRPKTSIFLSMVRQCIIIIPLLLIFGKIWGLWGAVYAAPVSDALSFLIVGVMIFFELRKLRSAGGEVHGEAH
jgi:Na+-driven multidrug efflux pump